MRTSVCEERSREDWPKQRLGRAPPNLPYFLPSGTLVLMILGRMCVLDLFAPVTAGLELALEQSRKTAHINVFTVGVDCARLLLCYLFHTNNNVQALAVSQEVIALTQ